MFFFYNLFIIFYKYYSLITITKKLEKAYYFLQTGDVKETYQFYLIKILELFQFDSSNSDKIII